MLDRLESTPWQHLSVLNLLLVMLLVPMPFSPLNLSGELSSAKYGLLVLVYDVFLATLIGYVFNLYRPRHTRIDVAFCIYIFAAFGATVLIFAYGLKLLLT